MSETAAPDAARPLRIAHLADTHIGYRALYRADPESGRNQRAVDVEAAYAGAITDILTRDVDLVIHAGDVFHHTRPSWQAMRSFVVESRRLGEAGLPAVVIAGNHDTPRLRTSGSAFSVLALALPNVRFVAGYELEEVDFADLDVLVSAVPHGALTGPNPPVPNPWPGKRNILVTHGLVPGLLPRGSREPGEELLHPTLLDAGFDYVALGHYHVWGPQGNNAWYSGSTERTGWGDELVNPGFNLVTLGAPGVEPEVERISLPARPMRTLHPIAGEHRAARELADVILDRAQALGDPVAMVRVELRETTRPVRREVEAILRRESSAVVWSLQVYSPADVLAPFGARSDEPSVLDLRALFAQFVDERRGGEYDEHFAALFRQRGGRALEEAIQAAELADTVELDAAPLIEAGEGGHAVILVSLEIENYKQFVGRHEIAPAAQGIVGVVGPNGVGKTTLFEAIEWCLYNPGSIRNEDVPPRAGVGQTLVRVTLEDPRDGIQYVVERRLKSKHVTADVYRVDEPENRLVQGSRQVSDYVARRLIGLSHRAFVSTFFTRQKELSFFGGLKETERRLQVARLLGLETIRVAQQSIGAERAEALAEARSLRAQHANEVAGRDFALEAEDADAVVSTAKERVGAAETLVVASAQATSAARTELDRWRLVQEEDNALALELTRVRGEEQTAQTQCDNAANDLARIDRDSAVRANLLPVAAEAANHLAAVAAHEAERGRHREREQVLADQRRADDGLRKTTAELERAVRRVPAGPGVPIGWAWSPEDGNAPLAVAERLIGLAASLDVDSACEREIELSRCLQLVQQRNEAADKATRYRAVLNRLHTELAGLVVGGDPREQAESADRERAAALASAEAAAARLRSAGEERGRLRQIVDALRAADFSDGCPTCARPFTPDQVDQTAAVLGERITRLQSAELAAAKERDDAQAKAKQHDATRRAALEILSKTDTLRGRIADGEAKVTEAEQEAEQVADACNLALKENGLTLDPTREEVTQAKTVADRFQQVKGSLHLLRQLQTTIAGSLDEAESAERRLAELGPVEYDSAAHEAADQALADAHKAAARIGELDRQIARRPEIETEHAAADADLYRLAKERARLEKQRAAVGFDATGLATAVVAERAAREAEKAALDDRQSAMNALAKAEHERLTLAVEHERIAGLAARADVRGREADELDRMYKEFTRFDQYVAERVTPQLAEHTGELLAAVTEGKYDRVAFDENYGLEIFDGEEHFPIGSFSGGERDVAALCARLALSRLVGGQAGHPPEFLVLDEVFGSLDRERRTQVMEMLGTLAGNTDVFRQLFIISHVDDVRASSVFNQVWRLSKSEEGVSQFEDITESGGADEF